MLGWMETEPEMMIGRKSSLCFSKERGAERISLPRRHKLADRN